MGRSTSQVMFCGLVAALLGCFGCGTSGSHPPAIPEMRFEIAPAAGSSAEFEIVEIQAGGQRYTSLAGQTITTFGRFNVFVENTTGPFGMTIRLLGNDPVEVRYGLAGVASDTGIRVVDRPGEAVVLGSIGPGAPQAVPEVRADVCAPFPGQTQCSVFDGNGVFGAPLSGSIGDTRATRLTGRPSIDESEVGTPAVYFYARPQDSVSVIQRAADARLLVLRLYVNGRLKDVDSDTGDNVVRSDL